MPDRISTILRTVMLRQTDPAPECIWYYIIMLERDQFGTFYLVCHFGRIDDMIGGTWPQTFRTEAEAIEMMEKHVAVKRRRGFQEF
jgi:predicted DNA-binding WGR domain protein